MELVIDALAVMMSTIGFVVVIVNLGLAGLSAMGGIEALGDGDYRRACLTFLFAVAMLFTASLITTAFFKWWGFA